MITIHKGKYKRVQKACLRAGDPCDPGKGLEPMAISPENPYRRRRIHDGRSKELHHKGPATLLEAEVTVPGCRTRDSRLRDLPWKKTKTEAPREKENSHSLSKKNHQNSEEKHLNLYKVLPEIIPTPF